jgi:hypothetical protein
MTKTAVLFALIVTALASMPAHAQRVFVSGLGLDTNPCTVNQPCRTFQQAYNTAPANGEIEALDPAGYGALTITHGISIQGHGWALISSQASCPTCSAITVNVTTSDPVTLNGLVLDGLGTGYIGININSVQYLQILNSVVRHFTLYGISYGNRTSNANLLIEDTIVSDILDTAFLVDAEFSTNIRATLNRITANNNRRGVSVRLITTTTIANSVMSNNSEWGLATFGAVTWLAKSVISGNTTGVDASNGTVKSYGDNYINDNTTPVVGSLTPVGMQ